MVIGFGVLITLDRFFGTKLVRKAVRKMPQGHLKNAILCIHAFFSCFTRTKWVNEAGETINVTWQRELRRMGQDWLAAQETSTLNNSGTIDTMVSQPLATRSRSLDHFTSTP